MICLKFCLDIMVRAQSDSGSPMRTDHEAPKCHQSLHVTFLLALVYLLGQYSLCEEKVGLIYCSKDPTPFVMP